MIENKPRRVALLSEYVALMHGVLPALSATWDPEKRAWWWIEGEL